MDEKETKNGITAVLPAAGISAPEPPSAPAAETPPESLPESPPEFPVLPAPADAPAPEETAAAGDPPPAPPAPAGSAASPSLSPAELADLRASYPDADPEQAVRRLTSWIRRCRPLYAELTRDGTPFDKRRYLTVREARLIMEYLGEA